MYKHVSRRLNDIIHASRTPGTKDGELEALGRELNLKVPDMSKLKKKVLANIFFPQPKSNSPILNGAIRLLGLAILKYQEKDYVFVFNIARAILTEICREVMVGSNPRECCLAAIELFSILCTDPEVPQEMRKEVFGRVIFACRKDLYHEYYKELKDILKNPALEKELQEIANEQMNNIDAVPQVVDDPVSKIGTRMIEEWGRRRERRLSFEDTITQRDEMIEAALAGKDYALVKRLVQEGPPWQYKKWNEILFTVAKEENDIAYIRKYHRRKYFSEGYNESQYEIARATCTPEEWKTELENYFDDFFRRYSLLEFDDVMALAKIYIREGMMEELLELVDDFFDPKLAEFVEPILLPKYETAFMAAYRDWFLLIAKEMKPHRNEAIALRTLLKDVCQSTRGKEIVKGLVPELLALHPTWKVYREELEKLP